MIEQKGNIDLTRPIMDPLALIVEGKGLLKQFEFLGLDCKKVVEILNNYHGLKLCDCFPKKARDPNLKNHHKKIYFDRRYSAPVVIEICKIRGLTDNQGLNSLKNEKKLITFNGQEIDCTTLVQLRKAMRRLGMKKYTYNSFKRKLSYSMRRLKAVLKDELISEEVKQSLQRDRDNLMRIKEEIIDGRNEAGNRLFHGAELNAKLKAKSISQMISFQLYQVFEYLDKFRVDCSKMALFRLISEILNVINWTPEYTPERVKRCFDNIVNTHTLEDLKKLSI